MSAVLLDALPFCPRTHWPSDFPDVFVHAKWSGSKPVSLRNNPKYSQAKKLGNERAAKEIVEFLLDEEAVYCVGDTISRGRRNQTYVVAPARTYESPRNMIPHVFAFIMAQELGLQVCMSIFQYDGVRRDRRDFWSRFANPVAFYGNLPRGGDFVIADDVVSTGGTLAAMRGFIENQRGNVICMAALASPTGENVKVSLDRATCARLKSVHGGKLPALILSETGYAVEQLTEPEAGVLLSARSPDAIRKAISCARHAVGVEEG